MVVAEEKCDSQVVRQDTDVAFITRREGCTLSTLGAFLLITKINWGIGMIAMPYYIHAAGLWSGVVFFIVTMLLSADSAWCLVRCRESVVFCQDEDTFAGLMKSLLGNFGQAGALFSLMLANWGSCVAWTKYIGDNLARFFPESGLSGPAWSCLVTLPLLLCALVEKTAFLERISSIGLVAGQTFVVLVVGQAASHYEKLSSYAESQPIVNWSLAPVAMGLAVFCNEGMCVMTPSIHAVMRKPERYSYALVAMVAYFTLNYLAVAVAGDFLYGYVAGGIVAQEVSLSFNVTPTHRIAVFLYIAQLLLSFPLVLFTLFASGEATILQGLEKRYKVMLRLLLILTMGGVAAVVPHFGDFLAVAGAIANSFGIYILPHMGLLVASHHGLKLSRFRRAFSLFVLICFGIVGGLMATIFSLQQLFY